MDFPWPEEPARTESRILGLVASVVRTDELRDVRIEWVTPFAHTLDRPDAQWVALRVTVAAGSDDVFQKEVWGPDWYSEWEDSLLQLASDLEDWVCETAFAWGELRHASVPD